MTLLAVWNDDPGRPAPARLDTALTATQDPDLVRDLLAAIGVRFDRWPVADLPDDADEAAILSAYRAQVDAAVAREGYALVDVARLRTGPGRSGAAAAARMRFRDEHHLDEHRHAVAEDRFFAAGSAVWYLHEGGRVYAVLCEPGDLLSVPPGMPHWFDPGEQPEFTLVRFFHDEGDRVGEFTGEPVAARYPTCDELAAQRDAADEEHSSGRSARRTAGPRGSAQRGHASATGAAAKAPLAVPPPHPGPAAARDSGPATAWETGPATARYAGAWRWAPNQDEYQDPHPARYPATTTLWRPAAALPDPAPTAPPHAAAVPPGFGPAQSLRPTSAPIHSIARLAGRSQGPCGHQR